jgi:CRISPR-associated endoribonuclease Cas6
MAVDCVLDNCSLTLPYWLYSIELSLASEKPVSRFLAATLRGGFGYTLKKVVCPRFRENCAGCMLKNNCAYIYLFESAGMPESPRLRKYKSVPRPFALRPRQTGKTISIELLLVGKAGAYLPYFIYALDRLGEQGLGKRRETFRVERVMNGDQLIYPFAEGTINHKAQPRLAQIEPGAQKASHVTVVFTSPLVLRKEGKVLHAWDTRAFFATLLRRVTNLNAFYGMSPELDIDPSIYMNALHSFHAQPNLFTRRLTRISTRQKKEIDYSGIMGSVELHGEIGPVLPLLSAGAIFGVGKNTVFGFGVYHLHIGTGLEE